MRHPAKRCTYDDTLLVTVLVLVIAGLVLLTSISAYNGNVKFHDSFYYLKKQGFATGLGLVGMAVVSRIDGFSLRLSDAVRYCVYLLADWFVVWQR